LKPADYSVVQAQYRDDTNEEVRWTSMASDAVSRMRPRITHMGSEPSGEEDENAPGASFPLSVTPARRGNTSENTYRVGRLRVVNPYPLRDPDLSGDGLNVLALWEGEVLGTDDDLIYARVYPRRGQGVVEDAEIPIDEIAPGDRDAVVSGARFWWAIGYETTRGTRRRVSQIRFRRLPRKTAREMDAARAQAQRWASEIPDLPRLGD
jgi:hypothetical protein